MSTPNKSFKELFSFDVSLPRDVEETNTRVEDGKTITETVKVARNVSIPICLKTPSRAEKEEAEIERAVWLNKYVERGLMLEAMLIRKYVDQGGTLPQQYQKEYNSLQVELFELEKKIIEAETLDKDNPELKEFRRRFFEVREEMIAIQKTQAHYFEDTAEAKARLKKIEWYVLHLSYHKPVNEKGEIGEWTPIFKGETTEEKMDDYDAKVEAQDPLLAKARPVLSFMAAALAHETDMSKEDVESFAASIQSAE